MAKALSVFIGPSGGEAEKPSLGDRGQLSPPERLSIKLTATGEARKAISTVRRRHQSTSIAGGQKYCSRLKDCCTTKFHRLWCGAGTVVVMSVTHDAFQGPGGYRGKPGWVSAPVRTPQSERAREPVLRDVDEMTWRWRQAGMYVAWRWRAGVLPGHGVDTTTG